MGRCHKEGMMPDLIRGIMIGVLIALLLDIGIQFLIVEPRLKKLIRRTHDSNRKV